MTRWGTLLSRSKAVSVVMCLMMSCGIEGEAGDQDAKMRQKVAKAISDAGYDGTITIVRNDEKRFPLPLPGVSQMVYFEAWEGGIEGQLGAKSTVVVSHRREWRVLVDPETMKVVKVRGFAGDRERGIATGKVSRELDETEGRYLAEQYVEMAYPDYTQVIRNELEGIGFITSVVGASEDDSVRECYREWLAIFMKDVWGRVDLPKSDMGDRGMVVSLNVGHFRDEATGRMRAELRRLDVLVTKDGVIRIEGDKEIVAVEWPPAGCASD